MPVWTVKSIIHLNNLHLPFIILLYFWQGIFVTRHNYLKQLAINHVSLFRICQVFANFVLTKHYLNTVWLCYNVISTYNFITVWKFLSVKSWNPHKLTKYKSIPFQISIILTFVRIMIMSNYVWDIIVSGFSVISMYSRSCKNYT